MTVKRVIIIQARMTSTRRPGKVLADLEERPMLVQQIFRLRHCRSVDQIVLATTTNATDDPLVALAEAERLGYYRGSEYDVLSRYYEAAAQFAADMIVRITADCPLIDAAIVDRVIDELVASGGAYAYACNVIERTYPRGLDVEAMARDTLEKCHRMATSAEDREHVTSFIRRDRTGLFTIRSVKDTQDNSDLRWTVDTESDLALVRRIYHEMDLGRVYRAYPDILAYVRAHPELTKANLDSHTWDPMNGRQK
ncbi:MAG: glycosyltransferase family protein [Candidatus Zixiibacteriota bacterium]